MPTRGMSEVIAHDEFSSTKLTVRHANLQAFANTFVVRQPVYVSEKVRTMKDGGKIVSRAPLGEARLVHFGNNEGHRREYQELFTSLFDLVPIVGRVGSRNIWALKSARSLLFGTIEDHYIGFVAVALLRAILGLPTVGIFLRPQKCFKANGTLRRTIKGWFFSGLKRVPQLSVCTIVPFAFAPHYAKVARFGVMDPHMWDKLKPATRAYDADLASLVIEQAHGRRILAFLGSVTPIKGIEFLMSLLRQPGWPEDKIFVVVAGKVVADLEEPLQRILRSRVLVIDRTISDLELDTLYNYCDWIWACYRPDYDQASGIFGRAVQFGRVPIVRAGAQIDHIATELGLTAIRLDFDKVNDGMLTLDGSQEIACVPDGAMLARWKWEFAQTIEAVL